ncbi:Ca(2+)-dependent cysteine protease [Linnemannia gamsii]|uniref:Ca(2+)-dependent cysteine protease n=1 Tax=Linnemannia gamsii TaxID=64522 RepID=A0A9P6RN29_9FUNG|nr:Ca(2+)-dependent cysteine protease [Linnemannia gamsii]
MSQPQQVGEPIVNEERIVTVLPDGRKVTKIIKKITHQYQIQVPAGTPVPEGATLISTHTAEGPIEDFGKSNGNGNGTTTYHTTTSSSSSYGNDNGIGNGNGTTTTSHTYSSSTSDSSSLPQELQQQFQEFSLGHGAVQTTTTNNEPTVVVSSHVDDNGRKVTKTTTTSSSSSSSPFKKFFKRFSTQSSSDSKPEQKQKPLPATPIEPVVYQTQTQTQTHHETHKPEVKVMTSTTYEASPEIKRHQLKVLEARHADGTHVSLSNCTGERRAVLIGINYTGHANALHGCVNDTAIMKGFLQDRGFEDDKIRILTDDQVGTCWMPTRENILENLKWLIRDAKKNDSYFLHYSGHGGQIQDFDGDETAGFDNCIFPLDHTETGVITDDELHNMLVKALPPGVRLTAVFDCCHSGSALDLPYLYASTGYIRGSSALANLGHELVEGNFDAEAIKELQAKWQKLQAEEKEFARQVSLKAADADVIMFSGCKDDQTSADVKVTRGGKSSSNGAMTYAFTKSIRENPEQSYQEMLNSIRDLLKEKYKQKPQLSSSRPMNMEELFHM